MTTKRPIGFYTMYLATVLWLLRFGVDAHGHTNHAQGTHTPESVVHEAGGHEYRCTHDPSHIKAMHVDDIAHSKRLRTESTAGVRRPMKFAFLPYNDAAGTSAKAVYLRDTIMPAVQKILSEIFTVETWDNSILNTESCTIDSTTLALPGVSGGDEDFYLMYDMYNLGSSGTIAQAGTCFILSSNSRPIVGIAAFDPDYVGPDTDYSEDAQIKVAFHEVLHALGFNSDNFDTTTATTRGKTRSYLNSAKVTTEAQDQSNCGTLPGAELEDDGGSGTAASHFEERVFGNEVMTGLINFRTMKVSRLTLAFFEDKNWSFEADYTKADTLFWGKNKGCSFHENYCLTAGTPGTPPPQTSADVASFPILTSSDMLTSSDNTANTYPFSKYGCTIGREYKGVATAAYLSESLPADFQYYADNNKRRGNGGAAMEYCPYYSAEEAVAGPVAQTSTAAGYCQSSGVNLGTNSAKEVYGADSRCFMVSDGMPYCFEYSTPSAPSGSTATRIRVAGETDWQTCACTLCDGSDGSTTVLSGSIVITCPPVDEIYGQSPNLIDPNLPAFTSPPATAPTPQLSTAPTPAPTPAPSTEPTPAPSTEPLRTTLFLPCSFPENFPKAQTNPDKAWKKFQAKNDYHVLATSLTTENKPKDDDNCHLVGGCDYVKGYIIVYSAEDVDPTAENGPYGSLFLPTNTTRLRIKMTQVKTQKHVKTFVSDGYATFSAPVNVYTALVTNDGSTNAEDFETKAIAMESMAALCNMMSAEFRSFIGAKAPWVVDFPIDTVCNNQNNDRKYLRRFNIVRLPGLALHEEAGHDNVKGALDATSKMRVEIIETGLGVAPKIRGCTKLYSDANIYGSAWQQ